MLHSIIIKTSRFLFPSRMTLNDFELRFCINFCQWVILFMSKTSLHNLTSKNTKPINIGTSFEGHSRSVAVFPVDKAYSYFDFIVFLLIFLLYLCIFLILYCCVFFVLPSIVMRGLFAKVKRQTTQHNKNT